jgi:hypothetical protein
MGRIDRLLRTQDPQRSKVHSQNLLHSIRKMRFP